MHGVVFLELRKYAIEKFGNEGWDTLQRQAGLMPKFYDASRAHPDEEFGKLFHAIVTYAKITPEAAMRDFGHYIVPDLVKVFKAVINPSWKALDLLEHIESVVHPMARVNNPGATPPVLDVQRAGNSLVINYSSKRAMAPFGIGIVEAILKFYNEQNDYKVVTQVSDGGEKAVIRVVPIK